jgi:hypothetical protein
MQATPKLSAFTVAMWTTLLFIVAMLGLCYRRACANSGYSLGSDEFFKGVLYNSSNCGGNSSALSRCGMIVLSARSEAEGNHGVFDYNALSPEAQQEFVKVTQSHWNPTARFLIRRGATDIGKRAKEIFVICDTAYGNVPQPTFWNLHHQNIAHAVGYIDGTRALISPKDYALLDKSQFVALPVGEPPWE